MQRQFVRISQLLTNEIGTAGYRGCLRVENANAIQIQPAATVPANWFSKAYPIKANTMAIHFEKMATWHDYLLVDHAEDEVQWVISAHQRLKAGDKVMIADCEHAQLAEVLTVNLRENQQRVTTTVTDVPFAAGSYFGLWQSKTFYIAITDRKPNKAVLFGVCILMRMVKPMNGPMASMICKRVS